MRGVNFQLDVCGCPRQVSSGPPDMAQRVNPRRVGRQQVRQLDFHGLGAMVTAHFEQIGDMVRAEPSGQANKPLVPLVLNADPAIHRAPCRGNSGADRGCASKRRTVVESTARAATAGGNLATGRDSSRDRHSQLVEYAVAFVTTDGEPSGECAGATPVLSSPPVAALLLPFTLALPSIGSNTLENPC